MKTTEWFPVEIAPIHTGWYECRFAFDGPNEGDYVRYWWDGSRWLREPGDPYASLWGNPAFPEYSEEFWRGLAGRAH